MNHEAYYVGDRPLTKLLCPLCGKEMLSQTFEYHSYPKFETRRGYLDASYYEANTCSVHCICPHCNGRCSVTDADIASLNLTVRYEPESFDEVEFTIMGVKSVRYGRIKNRGNYENERLECEVEVAADQTAEDAMIEAKRFVNKQLGLGPTDKDIEAAKQLLIEAGVKVA